MEVQSLFYARLFLLIQFCAVVCLFFSYFSKNKSFITKNLDL